MNVTEIEVHRIAPEYHDRLAYPLNHYCGPVRTQYRAMFKRQQAEGAVLEGPEGPR